MLLVCIGCFYFLFLLQEKEEKLNATYTAEATVRKIETQISRYLENSDLLKNIISSGHTVTDEEFSQLAGFMKKNQEVIEAYELAPDGIVSQIYPYAGNEEAMGMNMLELSERKREALMAKTSGKYTIAGPYELKQGGIGALLFDPIYMKEDDPDSFWGFSILVLNWNRFLEEAQIDKLDAAGYHFDVWKYDADGKKVTIMDCSHGEIKDAFHVSCEVPNDTWYFDIAPENGWVSRELTAAGIVLSVLIAALFTVGYWQTGMRRYRESIYAEKIEKSAREARVANEAKTRFLFNMSHDIRTPMNAIVGYANLLEDNLDRKEVALDYIKKIKASNSMLLSLINYILEMARIESGKVDLKQENGNLKRFLEMLQVVSEQQMQQKKLHFSWNLDVVHENVICDITKIREIVLNIVTNAIKYTPNGGDISVTIRETAAKKDGYGIYQFIVKDTGIGMHEEYLPHIFEEFSREKTSTESKVSGVGLGLPIVKSLVDMMGGTIGVESHLAQGTTFTVSLELPIAEKKVQEVKKKEKLPEPVAFEGKKILLVEDNELNAEIAMEILKMEGIHVDLAENGQRCLKMLDEKPEGYYDAILMDIQMPGMNGYDAARAIRKRQDKNADIPIIAMTANAFEEDKEQAIQAGMNGHIAKPVDVEKMFETLGSVLAST